MSKPHKLTKIALVAAVYAALTLLPPFSSISYGAVQVRVAEALTVLPYLAGEYAWGLYIGCIIANLGSPFLAYDLTLGAFTTLAAGLLTARMPKPWLAPLPPVILNALVVSWYVARLSGLPYAPTAAYIFAGEAAACFVLGYPLLLFVLRNKRVKDFLS